MQRQQLRLLKPPDYLAVVAVAVILVVMLPEVVELAVAVVVELVQELELETLWPRVVMSMAV
jgi:hypothetical protein